MLFVMLSAPMGVNRSAVSSALIRGLRAEGLRRVTVLSNDVAVDSADAMNSRICELERRTLNNACVSCSLKPDLVEELRRMERESDPQAVIFEANPNAHPVMVLDALEDLNGLTISNVAVVMVLDAVMFHERAAVHERPLRQQLGLADLVVMDNADGVAYEELEEMESTVASWGHRGPFLRMLDGGYGHDLSPLIDLAMGTTVESRQKD